MYVASTNHFRTDSDRVKKNILKEMKRRERLQVQEVIHQGTVISHSRIMASTIDLT